MTDTIFNAPPRPTLAVAGSDSLFPVHRIYCVARNYEAHAREMGMQEREAPFFFCKPADAVVADGAVLEFPSRTENLHHEVELVVALAKGGRDLSVAAAGEAIYGYAVGLDLTRRDLQALSKEKGRPWDTAKAFDQSAPVSALTKQNGLVESGAIELRVNGELRQQGDLADMIWSVPEVIAELSTYFELQPGDLIFTGTPAGVGPIVPGDKLAAGIEGVGELNIAFA